VALVLCALAKRNPEGCRAWQLCASREVGRRICVVAGRQADMKKKLLVAPMLVLATFSCLAADLPDPALTPGAINPHVTQANIGSTVCVKGWTKTVRPPAFYTNRLKKLQIRQYGYSDTDPRDYEEDHLVPLSVGGNPTDPRNLWPEPRNSEWNADRKDELEFALYMGVCHDEVGLDEARQAFATNWIDAYRRYGSLLQRYRYGSAD
jgi:hypothetical protein